VARDEPLGLEPVESPSAVRHVDELMSSRSEPNGLQVERLETERLGRVGGHCPFHDVSVGETAAPDLSGECGEGKNPLQIRRRKDQAESLGTTDKTS